MEVTLRIKKDNGEIIEVVQEIISIDNDNLIDRVEQEVTAIKESMLPLLSESLIEHEQREFKGKKNKEKERF